MADLLKEEIRQTAGAAAGAAAIVQVEDGTAGGRATVLPLITTAPAPTDNPLLVKALGTDSPLLQITFPDNSFVPGEVTMSESDFLVGIVELWGPNTVSGNDRLVRASVMAGIAAVPGAADCPLLVKPIGSIAQFAQQNIATPALADLTPGNANYLYTGAVLLGASVATANAWRPVTVLDSATSVFPGAGDNLLLTMSLVNGPIPHDSPIDASQSPILVGAAASADPAAAVSADGDVVRTSADRRGRTRVRGDNVAAVAGNDGSPVTLAAGDNTIAANVDRLYIEIQNNTGAVIYLCLGAAATTSDFEIADGQTWYCANPAVYTGTIHLNSALGGDVNILEY